RFQITNWETGWLLKIIVSMKLAFEGMKYA
ncbi:MAG: hypothetical protein K0Q54_3129, partial [Methylobacterium brachiatum]|nr:hypothetical protein [Methylobacterium brachiatum]